eukprot:scaffold7273_cov349-Ochromonas_danica.AAC.4
MRASEVNHTTVCACMRLFFIPGKAVHLIIKQHAFRQCTKSIGKSKVLADSRSGLSQRHSHVLSDRTNNPRQSAGKRRRFQEFDLDIRTFRTPQKPASCSARSYKKELQQRRRGFRERRRDQYKSSGSTIVE